MSKVPMILEIKLSVEEAQNKVRVREESHGETCDRSPISDFLIINGFCNDGASKHMSHRIHIYENGNL